MLNRTKCIPEIAGPSGPVAQFEAIAISYEDRYKEWLQALRQLTISLGERHQAERTLDRQIRGVGLAILTVSHGRWDSEVLRKYFPKGYGAVLRLRAEESLPIAAGLLEMLEEETSLEILFRREHLATARDRLESAVAAHAAAADALGEARAALEKEKLAWWKAHNRFYFMLRDFYSDRRSYVESLFRVTGRRRRTEDDEEDDGKDDGAGADDEAAVATMAKAVDGEVPSFMRLIAS